MVRGGSGAMFRLFRFFRELAGRGCSTSEPHHLTRLGGERGRRRPASQQQTARQALQFSPQTAPAPRCPAAAHADAGYLEPGERQEPAGIWDGKRALSLLLLLLSPCGFHQISRYPPNFSLVHHIGATKISQIHLNAQAKSE